MLLNTNNVLKKLRNIGREFHFLQNRVNSGIVSLKS